MRHVDDDDSELPEGTDAVLDEDGDPEDTEIAFEDDDPDDEGEIGEDDPDPDEDDGDATDAAIIDDLEAQPSPDKEEAPAPTVEDLAADVVPSAGAAVELVRYGDLRIQHGCWTNPRRVTGLSDAKLAELAASIKEGTVTHEDGEVAGVREPLHALKVRAANRDGFIVLVIKGQRRYLATGIALAGKGLENARVPVIYREPEIVDLTPAVAATYALEELDDVETREGLSSYEILEVLAQLDGQKNPDGKPYTMAELGAKAHRSPSWVSKMLGAYRSATPKLLAQWRKGEISDEQFRDVGSSAKGEKQEAVVEKIIEAKATGGAGAARQIAKEVKAKAQQAKADTKKAKAAKEPKKQPKLAKGEQASIAIPPPLAPIPRHIIDTVVNTSIKHPPTHDYVKGVLDGLKMAIGTIDISDLGKPWSAWAERVGDLVQGAAPKAKAKKARKK